MGVAFRIGRQYTRNDVFAVLGISPPPTGGNWFTGYNQHDGDWFIFANVGVHGRTGHDYVNHWIGNELHWEGKTGSRRDQPAIQSMIQGRVHVFTRTDDRLPFTYEGIATPAEVQDTVPVTIVW